VSKSVQKSLFAITKVLLIGAAMSSLCGCILISAAGTVATTAVKATVGIAGETIETTADVLIPDGDDGEEDKKRHKKREVDDEVDPYYRN
jgi:hypothetical protein